MIITLDMRSRIPIYEQLITSVREQAVKGILAPDEQLPSVRQLASELAINPNTIQKAYTELERQGVLYSLPGRGNFVSADIAAVAEQERNARRAALREQLLAARSAGISRAEITELADAVYRENTEKEGESSRS